MSIILDFFERIFAPKSPNLPDPIEYWETVEQHECKWTLKGKVMNTCCIVIQRCGYKHRVIGSGYCWKDHPFRGHAKLMAEEMEGKAKVEYYRILEALSVDERRLVERGLLDPFKIQLETT